VRVGLNRKFGVIPHRSSAPPTAMEGEDAIYDVFSSAGLWKESTLFADSDPYESTLFAPLQLDSKRRVFCISNASSITNPLQSPPSSSTTRMRQNTTSNMNCACLIWTLSNSAHSPSSTAWMRPAYSSKHHR
jgi:hypothetical protein